MSAARSSLRSRVVVVAALLTAFAAAPLPALASTSLTPPLPCDNLRFADGIYTGGSPRVTTVDIAGVPTFMLVPPGYETSDRRYPVIFLFHGAFSHPDQFLDSTDLIDFTATLPDAQQAIVVLPSGGDIPLWVDWQDGTHEFEQLFLDELVPYVDHTYRTLPDRAHRAVAGWSGGGGGAASLAARHPELFAALGVFSGAVDFFHPAFVGSLAGLSVTQPLCDGDAAHANPFAVFGNQLSEPGPTQAADPITLAPRLHDVDVRMYAGNGLPCDTQDTLDAGALEIGLEAGVKDMSDRLHAALAASGVAHQYDAYGCGLHTRRYLQRDLHAWWGPVLDVIDGHQSFGQQ